MNGKVYVVGGCDTWNCLNTVECYDPETNSWSFIKPIITPRRGCGLAHIKGQHLVLFFLYILRIPPNQYNNIFVMFLQENYMLLVVLTELNH